MNYGEIDGRPTRTLLVALQLVPDPRARRGRRYALTSLLALAVCAMLAGARSLSAIAQWGRDHGGEALRPLGFEGERMPCVATFHLLFKELDREAFERVLGCWFSEVARGTSSIGIDGKRLRGSAHDVVPGVHLVSAFSQEVGVTLGQEACQDKGGELGALRQLLKTLPIADTVVTGDAQFTQRDVAQAIVEKGGRTSLSSRTTSPA